ncbi:PREDICTED: complexin-2-like [Nestor notabilis]|uniref:complexin-2-like n=1 Tax=Nestor notabilis TaxID=176057 RepID=UPI0005235E2F|nr:PREDICTED: complexin-2-like [Nestor notabilis]
MDFVMKQALGGEWLPSPLTGPPLGAMLAQHPREHGGKDISGLNKKEEKEAVDKSALEQPCEGSLTRPKKAIPAGCGDEEEEEEESILDTVLKYLPGPLQDMFKK